MKKTYLQPSLEEVVITPSSLTTASESDMITEDVHDDEIDGDKAWSRAKTHYSVWEEKDEE